MCAMVIFVWYVYSQIVTMQNPEQKKDAFHYPNVC